MQIDGKKINSQIGENLFKEIQDQNIKPSLGILCVGNDPASLSFISVKQKFGEKYGFDVSVVNLDVETAVETIKEKLVSMQTRNHAVILQLPLPEKFKNNTEEILKVIDRKKDVDDLNNGDFASPIVIALEKVLTEVGADFKHAKFAIVGLGQVVGVPIKEYLDGKNFQNIVIGRGEYEKLKDCDVVISGVGVPFLIKGEYVKQGAVLVDYGCSFVEGKACGDFDPDCFAKASHYTPVPGCMGPLVVACLFENVLKSVKI
jgi:methylenetetrahydrofolate dehydrogenase (NADP+)/methenyltetrahydrofolate cyclohydrolase